MTTVIKVRRAPEVFLTDCLLNVLGENASKLA